MIERPIEFWSDFDGTAVKKLQLWDPRNSSKYPLPPMKGYTDFIEGVGSEVPIGGVVSRRPNIAVRRWATNRSVKAMGLGEVFPPERIIHTGGELAKAAFVSALSERGPIGMLEDAARLVPDLAKIGAHKQEFGHPIVIGMVEHPKREQRIDAMAAEILKLLGTGVYLEEAIYGQGFSVHSNNEAHIHVIQMPPLGKPAGKEFGRIMKAAGYAV